VSDGYTAHQSVEHDDLNVLCLGARVIGPELARELVHTLPPGSVAAATSAWPGRGGRDRKRQRR
jgi:ribose 5-phosphate isomerase RpiB